MGDKGGTPGGIWRKERDMLRELGRVLKAQREALGR